MFTYEMLGVSLDAECKNLGVSSRKFHLAKTRRYWTYDGNTEMHYGFLWI